MNKSSSHHHPHYTTTNGCNHHHNSIVGLAATMSLRNSTIASKQRMSPLFHWNSTAGNSSSSSNNELSCDGSIKTSSSISSFFSDNLDDNSNEFVLPKIIDNNNNTVKKATTTRFRVPSLVGGKRRTKDDDYDSDTIATAPESSSTLLLSTTTFSLPKKTQQQQQQNQSCIKKQTNGSMFQNDPKKRVRFDSIIDYNANKLGPKKTAATSGTLRSSIHLKRNNNSTNETQQPLWWTLDDEIQTRNDIKHQVQLLRTKHCDRIKKLVRCYCRRCHCTATGLEGLHCSLLQQWVSGGCYQTGHDDTITTDFTATTIDETISMNDETKMLLAEVRGLECHLSFKFRREKIQTIQDVVKYCKNLQQQQQQQDTACDGHTKDDNNDELVRAYSEGLSLRAREFATRMGYADSVEAKRTFFL